MPLHRAPLHVLELRAVLRLGRVHRLGKGAAGDPSLLRAGRGAVPRSGDPSLLRGTVSRSGDPSLLRAGRGAASGVTASTTAWRAASTALARPVADLLSVSTTRFSRLCSRFPAQRLAACAFANPNIASQRAERDGGGCVAPLRATPTSKRCPKSARENASRETAFHAGLGKRRNEPGEEWG